MGINKDGLLFEPNEECGVGALLESILEQMSAYNDKDVIKYAVPVNKELSALGFYIVQGIVSDDDMPAIMGIIKGALVMAYMLGRKRMAAETIFGGVVSDETENK